MIRKAIRTYKHSFIVASLLAISTVALSVCFVFFKPALGFGGKYRIRGNA